MKKALTSVASATKIKSLRLITHDGRRGTLPQYRQAISSSSDSVRRRQRVRSTMAAFAHLFLSVNFRLAKILAYPSIVSFYGFKKILDFESISIGK